MKTKLALIIICLSFFACNKNDEGTGFTSEWDEDISYFSKNLKKNHKNLFHNLSEAEFDASITALRENVVGKTDSDIYISLLKIISKIGDSHTSISVNNSWFSNLPLEVFIAYDGVLITGISEEYQQFIGDKIVAINGNDIEIVLDSFRDVIAFENEYCFKWFVTSYMRIPELYYYFGFSDSNNTLIINLESGNNIELVSGNFSMVTIYDNIDKPLYLSNTQRYYWHQQIENSNILYIQYNKAKEMNSLSFNTFTNQVSEIVNQNSNINKIVVDLRLNSGGNSLIAKPLIQLLHSYVANDRLSADSIFTIIGRKTFSSAVLNSIELKNSINPVFIGEPSGGKPNHFGEVMAFSLPYSQIKVRYSTKYFSWLENDYSSLLPNIEIELNSNDIIEGNDPILDYISSN